MPARALGVLLLCAAVLASASVTVVHLLTAATASASVRVEPAAAPPPVAPTPFADPSAAQDGTRRVTLAAADRAGAPATGWTVRDGDTQVDCGYASPAAVSPGIQTCSPTAAAADVCWPATDGRAVTCLVDPWSRELVRYPATGADVAVSPEAHPSPVGLELSDGTHCRLRNGGAWSGRPADPGLFGAYSCSAGDDLIVWADDIRTIDESAPEWTVRVGTPTGRLRTLPVAVVYYVATA